MCLSAERYREYIPASTKAADDKCPLKKMMQHSVVVPGAQSSRLELKKSNFPALLIFSGFEKFPIQQLGGAALTSGSFSWSLARPWPWCSPLLGMSLSLSQRKCDCLESFCMKFQPRHLSHGKSKPQEHLDASPSFRYRFWGIHLGSLLRTLPTA